MAIFRNTFDGVVASLVAITLDLVEVDDMVAGVVTVDVASGIETIVEDAVIFFILTDAEVEGVISGSKLSRTETFEASLCSCPEV